VRIRREQTSSFVWKRTQDSQRAAMAAVEAIVNEVRAGGDRAVRQFTVQYDGVEAAGDPRWPLRIEASQLEAAWQSLSPSLQDALKAAAERIRNFHAMQIPDDIHMSGADGERLGLVWRSLGRVGVYAPGGRAAYPSTVLMNVIPANVAGVRDIVLVSPPNRDTGMPHPLVLAAAHLAGVTEVYRIGGAQAVAALAYGTESIAPVDKIVGPGNLYVALSKRLVMGDVGIDSIAGPSEVFVIADESADPRFVAADLLAQAEHDPEAGAVCITTSATLADEVERALEEQLATLPRAEIARASLENWGAIVIADSIDEAVRIANECAPEHLELLVEHPDRWLGEIRTAGAVFLGPYTPEPVGDYYAGTNHVLPTFGSARFSSGLGVHDFLRRMSYVEYTQHTLTRHCNHIEQLAMAEGLEAHARSVAIRLDQAGISPASRANGNDTENRRDGK
jgi:histidinol dehydrogenase